MRFQERTVFAMREVMPWLLACDGRARSVIYAIIFRAARLLARIAAAENGWELTLPDLPHRGTSCIKGTDSGELF